MILIEVSGPQGAGKTTIAQEILQMLGARGIDAQLVDDAHITQEALVDLNPSALVFVQQQEPQWLTTMRGIVEDRREAVRQAAEDESKAAVRRIAERVRQHDEALAAEAAANQTEGEGHGN